MSTARFSIFWDVENAGKYTGVPVRQRTQNDLDAHGTFLDLPRLAGEPDYSYFRRLQSVLPLRGGANHEGLVHGLTRELGLEEYIGLKISPVMSGGKWLAPSPYVEITAQEVILYSQYADEDDNTVDTRVDIFNHGSGYLLGDLVSQIQTSEYFVAELGSDMTGDEKSNGLFPGSSCQVVSKEWVPTTTYFALEHSDVIPGSIYFTEKEIFMTELSTAIATPSSSGFTISWAVSDRTTQDGEYFVDYENGLVTVYNCPSGRGTCRYVHREFPWYVRWSPIVVYSLRDDVYRDNIFEEETMLDNSTQLGLTNAEGVEVYTQLFNKSPSLWGE